MSELLQYALTGLATGATYALVGLGIALIVQVTGVINFAQGDFVMLGALSYALLAEPAGHLLAAALAVGLVVCVGAVTNLTVIRPARRASTDRLIILTIGASIVIQGATLVLAGTGPRFADSFTTGGPIRIGGASLPLQYLWVGGVTAVAVLAVWAFLTRTRQGIAMRATAMDGEAARMVGISPHRMSLAVFVVASALAAIAGSLYAHWIGYVDPSVLGLLLSLQLLISATVGGLRTVWGAPVGAFVIIALLQLSQQVLSQVAGQVDGQTEIITYGIALVVTLLLLPEGLAGACQGVLRRHRRGTSRAPGVHRPDVIRGPAHAEPFAFEMDGLRVAFGGVDAVDDLTVAHDQGGVLGLIGPNGAGKTTVLNVLSGVVRPNQGVASINGVRVDVRRSDRIARMGVARTFQNLQLFASLSVLDNVLVTLEASSGRASPAQLRAHAGTLLAEVGLSDHLDARLSELPYGTQRRVELARAMGAQPRLLLLDEPLAGLSRAESDELTGVIRRLSRSGVSVLLVEHDVTAVMRTCDRVVVLDQGRLLADGTPAEVQADAQVRTAYFGAELTSTGTARPVTTADPAMSALEVHDLVAGYGRIEALHGVAMHVSAGGAAAVVGPNGAGKTTLLKTVAGLVPARRGRILVHGQDVTAWSAERRVRAGIMLVPEGRHVFAGLTVAENLALGAHARQGSASELRSRRERVLDVFPRPAGRLDQPAGTLSGGNSRCWRSAERCSALRDCSCSTNRPSGCRRRRSPMWSTRWCDWSARPPAWMARPPRSCWWSRTRTPHSPSLVTATCSTAAWSLLPATQQSS
jgi:ABC-type branched-subunit amino acid transport system ATPase component/branched-subunit amino acid ABC-type transport system permease component